MSMITRAMTSDGSAVAFVTDTTDIVNSAIEYHKTSATASAALGRTLTAASLMGAQMKNREDSLTLTFRGDGPAGIVLAVSDYRGRVKGYIENPDADLPLKPNGKLDVSGIIGHGIMTVVRDIGLKEPVTGISQIRSGEIAEDVAAYYVESEQTPTLLALGVLIKNGLCIGAGGVFIQLMPGADDEVINRLEANAPSLSELSALIASGADNDALLALALKDIPYEPFDEFDTEYFCDCSRERTLAAAKSIGKTELEKIFSEQEQIEVICRFCNKKFVFDKSITEGM